METATITAFLVGIIVGTALGAFSMISHMWYQNRVKVNFLVYAIMKALEEEEGQNEK